jgi:defect-in-organelle-trafficking protein DotC
MIWFNLFLSRFSFLRILSSRSLSLRFLPRNFFTICVFFSFIFSTILLSGCSSFAEAVLLCGPKKGKECSELPEYCKKLEELCPGPELNAAAKIGGLRTASLRDIALSVGARGGLSYRACEINKILLKQEHLLNRVYNFNAMLLDKNILPPVLIEGRNTLQLTGTDAIRIADRNYQILRQAKFVTLAPTWRDYLWMNYPPPEIPHGVMLPKSQAERMLWKRFLDEGWRCGITQADTIFRENIGRLKRDYEGMIRYKTLLAQCMVSPPYVAELDMGVTGGGSDMTVNDRVLRITAFPALQNDSRTWKTEIIPSDVYE